MINVNLKTVGTIAGKLGKLAILGLMMAGPTVRITLKSHSNDDVTARYEDAVNAIMRSGMWSSDKVEAVSVIKTGASAEYYGAVIGIAKSDMWSSDKLKSIKLLAKE